MSETTVDAGGVEFPVKWGFDLQKGPDGKTWCVIAIGSPFANYATMFPPEIAERLGKELPSILFGLAKKARTQDGAGVGDLVIAPASTLDKLTRKRTT